MADDNDNVITIELVDSRDVQMHFETEKDGSLQSIFDKYSSFKRLPREYIVDG